MKPMLFCRKVNRMTKTNQKIPLEWDGTKLVKALLASMDVSQEKKAEIAKFTPQEQREYEASKMAYRDIKNSIDTRKEWKKVWKKAELKV